MMTTSSEVLIPPVTALAVSGALAASTFLTGGAPVPFFGVGMGTLGMAVAGSLLAFAYGTPVKNIGRLLGYSLGGIFLGVWGVLLLPAMFSWEWYYELGPDVAQPPLAGFTAMVSRWAIPMLVENLPALWNRVFHTGTSSHSGGGK